MKGVQSKNVQNLQVRVYEDCQLKKGRGELGGPDAIILIGCTQ